MDVDGDEIAGRTLADEVVTRLDRIEPARDLGQAERNARGVAGVDHLPALVDVEGHRLLEQDVLACGGRGQDVGQVGGVRRGDHHGVDVRASEECLDRGFVFGPEFGGEGRGAGPTGDGHQGGSTSGLFGDGHGMDVGHPARADHPEPDGHSGAPSAGRGARARGRALARGREPVARHRQVRRSTQRDQAEFIGHGHHLEPLVEVAPRRRAVAHVDARCDPVLLAGQPDPLDGISVDLGFLGRPVVRPGRQPEPQREIARTDVDRVDARRRGDRLGVA